MTRIKKATAASVAGFVSMAILIVLIVVAAAAN
jgi:hypothetical protein